MTQLNRRTFIIMASGTAAAAVLAPTPSFANNLMEKMSAFTGGAPVTDGGIDLSMPEIAENSNTVPLSVSVDSPMTEDAYAEHVIILADGNPNADVATFHFTPQSGAAEASTRMRLAKTQNVVAVARMNDGSFRKTEALVKVTIGGCGG